MFIAELFESKTLDPDLYGEMLPTATVKRIVASVINQVDPDAQVTVKQTPEGYYSVNSEKIRLDFGITADGGDINANIVNAYSSYKGKNVVTEIFAQCFQAAEQLWGKPAKFVMSAHEDRGQGVWQHIAQKLGAEWQGSISEISDELRRGYLARAGKVVDRRMDHMARVRDRLNKGYEIYHADRPTAIVDRFDADTPAEARRYYEKFVHEYESDVDFDLRLRRSTGIIEQAVNPMRKQAGQMIDKYFGKIYEYGDSGLDYLDNHAPVWFELSDQYNGDIDVIIATAPVNLLVKAAQELKNVASDLGYELSEAAGAPQYVTRIDSTEIKDFSSNMPTYYHTKDWSQSGQFKPGSKIPKNFSGKVQGTFAGDPHRTALYATGNANETRFVEFIQNGQPIVYFDKKDLSRMRGRKTYLTVFDAANFKKLPTGEYFSNDPGKPIKQEPIADPFQYIASQGWIVRITDDLDKVLRQVQTLHKAGKIPQYGGEGMDTQANVNEITAVPTVAKSKRQHLDVMPNDGRPIPKGEEAEHLGKPVADMGSGLELWSWASHGTVTYYVFDTATRTSQLATTGRPYKTNRDSFVIQGVYSGPKNQLRAADLYAFLILNQGLTLVSDNKQSEGGYRVWQELERRYKTINVHGFDTRTDQGVNVTTQDEPDTHVDRADVKRAGPQMKRELGSISRDLRFVASAR